MVPFNPYFVSYERRAKTFRQSTTEAKKIIPLSYTTKGGEKNCSSFVKYERGIKFKAFSFVMNTKEEQFVCTCFVSYEGGLNFFSLRGNNKNLSGHRNRTPAFAFHTQNTDHHTTDATRAFANLSTYLVLVSHAVS